MSTRLLSSSDYKVSEEVLHKLKSVVPSENKILSEPTGNFYYDPWIISPSIKNTVYHEVLESLPVKHGQARIFLRPSGTCYNIHGDMENRWHFNLTGEQCYLIDLESFEMFPTVLDGKWYYLDTSILHSTANFGFVPRFQVVIRDLLIHGNIVNPVNITLKGKILNDKLFMEKFHKFYVCYLNKKNKEGHLDNYQPTPTAIHFTIEEQYVSEIESICPNEFIIEKN